MTKDQIEAWRGALTGLVHLLNKQAHGQLRNADKMDGGIQELCDLALKGCAPPEAPLKPASMEQAKDVAMKATLCAQIMLQNPVVIANEKARHICVDTRDTANAFLAAHPEVAPIDPGTEKILWNLLDRAYKMMLMAIGPVHEQDPDSNDPIVAWASDVRKVLYGSGRVPSLADLQSLPSPRGTK